MKRTMLLAAYGMALSLAVLSTAVSQTTGTLTGRVTDDHNTPLVRATVMVTGGPGTYTMSDGTFLLPNIRAGVVDVVIRYAGKKGYGTQVRISIGQITTLNTNLETNDASTASRKVQGCCFCIFQDEHPRRDPAEPGSITIITGDEINGTRRITRPRPLPVIDRSPRTNATIDPIESSATELQVHVDPIEPISTPLEPAERIISQPNPTPTPDIH